MNSNSVFSRVRAWVLALVAFICLGTEFLVQKVSGLQLVPKLGANSIDSDLQLDVIMDTAMTAFKELLAPLALFSTAFYDIPLQGTDIVQVPYYPLETAASKDFNGTYVFNVGTDTQAKPITIDKRKYQPLSFTSAEARRQPKLDPEKLGMLKGAKLAEDILVDVLSLVTAANYGAAGFTGAATDYDVDDVIDQETAAQVAKWPVQGRGIIVKNSYMGGLKKDMNSNGGLATFGRDSNGAVQTFPTLSGFSFAGSNIIPANAENLVGMAVYHSAVLVGFSPVEPVAEVRSRLNRYEVTTDVDTGITLEYREWGDPDTDTAKRTIEANYGRAVGEAAALSRMVSA